MKYEIFGTWWRLSGVPDISVRIVSGKIVAAIDHRTPTSYWLSA